MPRTTYSAIVIVILAMGMLSSNARAAAKFVGNLCDVSIDLPDDRWTLTKAKENVSRGWVNVSIRDSHYVANVRFIAEARRHYPQYATIDEWFEKRIAPRRLEGYSSGYDYSIISTKKSEATLGSGEVAKVVDYYLDINNNFRNVRFAYFPNSDGTHWHFVFVSNKGVDRDLERPFQKIMKGFTLEQ